LINDFLAQSPPNDYYFSHVINDDDGIADIITKNKFLLTHRSLLAKNNMRDDVILEH